VVAVGAVGAVVVEEDDATPSTPADDDADDLAQIPSVTVAAAPANMSWRRVKMGSRSSSWCDLAPRLGLSTTLILRVVVLFGDARSVSFD